MRAVSIASAVVAVAIAAACASFGEGDPSSREDAGAPAPAADGGAPGDAGSGALLSVTPGTIPCGITQEQSCNLAAGKVCCHEPIGEPSCKETADKCNAAGSWTYRCDEQADCDGGLFCCFYPRGDGSKCVSTCGNEPALCVTSDACPGGGTCNLYDCQGRVRGICGNLTATEQVATRCTPR